MLRSIAAKRCGVHAQAKLAVGPVDDPFEHEADAVADQVMRMPDPRFALRSAPPLVSRMATSGETDDEAPEAVHQAIRSPGRRLDEATRGFFEPRFGADLSNIQVHTGESAEASARSVGALAYTVGPHVVFAPGQYAPQTESGQRLLAHELAHTVQQGAAGGGNQTLQRPVMRVPDPQPAPAAAGTEANEPAGAPAVFEFDFDPVPGDSTAPAQPAESASDPATMQRSVDSSVTLQRQPAPAQAPAAPAPAQAPAAAPAVAQALSWTDFTPVPNRLGGMSAQTAVRLSWHNDGSGFKAAFNPAASWTVVADQTAALLRHEQYHLNLAVLMANKANAAQAAGTLTGAALIAAFRKASATHDRSYDADTEHSQNARLQALWEQDIDAGVPSFPIS